MDRSELMVPMVVGWGLGVLVWLAIEAWSVRRS